jgi:hypothetical protein
VRRWNSASPEVNVDVRRAYCSAVDRNVPVVLRKGTKPRGRLIVAPRTALRCLDYPARCTGWCCPLNAAEAADPSQAAGGSDARRPPSSRKRWTRPT